MPRPSACDELVARSLRVERRVGEPLRRSEIVLSAPPGSDGEPSRQDLLIAERYI
jgi:hypothetical protein